MCDIKISVSQGYASLSAALYIINGLYLEGFREKNSSAWWPGPAIWQAFGGSAVLADTADLE
ncbi:MAG: hypothetical protein CMQ69_05920 [Gammaproteobacteria bacterium]|nr:hypothetical protein [Gammaproteobacteria bacterium]MEE3011843.1 hypothetical protein [Pseudomonadota bacterium]|tara:strand:- start:67 stop:252 length:186 start_codon:yes stop_codon:yes gene_type:complete